MLDVSSWAGPAQWWAGVDMYPKQRAHTAMADIRESIAEMKYLREHLGLNRVRPSIGGQLVRNTTTGLLGITAGDLRKESFHIDVQYVGGQYPVREIVDDLVVVHKREANA